MAELIAYFEKDGAKIFDVAQALQASGWGIGYKDLLSTTDLKLIDRNDPTHKATISSITFDKIMNIYFVHFVGGGWLCLDHAIILFRKDAHEKTGNHPEN